MKKGVIVSLLVLAGLLFSTMATVFGQSFAIGVSKGDVFTYTSVGFWSSDLPDDECPSDVLDMNATEWIRVEVTDVVDGIIHIETTRHFVNGTENSVTGFVNWTNPENTNLIGIIPANLKANDKISGVENSDVINNTIVKTYTIGGREVNIVNHTRIFPTMFLGSDLIDASNNWYTAYDRKMGITVEFYSYFTTTRQSSYTTYKSTQMERIELVSSSAWTVPEFPSFLIFSVLITSMLAGAILYTNKFKISKIDGQS